MYKRQAEAFALGIVLFSAGMREAFAAGILVILTVVFAEFLKNLLEKCSLPDWSFRLCVYIAAGAVGASAFLLGFAGLGILLDRGPVSYTHLDVYKRQGLRRGLRLCKRQRIPSGD